MVNSVINCIFCGRENEVDPNTKNPKPCICEDVPEHNIKRLDKPKPKSVTGTVHLSILCRCPYCDDLIDVFSEVPESDYYGGDGCEYVNSCWNLITNNNPEYSFECTCPSCKEYFEVNKVEY